MIKHNQPITFSFSGNIEKAQALIWKAREFMGQMYQFMSFQKLKFHRQRFQDGEGNIYFCSSNQNGLAAIDSCEIVAVGGSETDILEGFIVKIESISAYLTVQYIDALEDAAFYDDGDKYYVDNIAWSYMGIGEGLPNDYGINDAPDSDTYVLYYDPTGSSTEKLPFIPRNVPGYIFWRDVRIRQAEVPRVRYFSADYVHEDDTVKLDNDDIAAVCAVVLPASKYQSKSYFITPTEWEMSGDVAGTYEIYVEGNPGDEIDVEIEFFGTVSEDKRTETLTFGMEHKNPSTYNDAYHKATTQKIVITVGKPVEYKPGDENPHVKIEDING